MANPSRFAPSAAILIASLGFALAASCGGSVDGASSSSGASSSAGAGGGTACEGPRVQCADQCGSDFFPEQADCKDGEWVCPVGTVDPSDCPSGNCCVQDIDCGDLTLSPCVNGVCKEPVADGCWSDVECKPGMVCEGEGVCECGANCLVPDMPGKCVPG